MPYLVHCQCEPVCGQHTPQSSVWAYPQPPPWPCLPSPLPTYTQHSPHQWHFTPYHWALTICVQYSILVFSYLIKISHWNLQTIFISNEIDIFHEQEIVPLHGIKSEKTFVPRPKQLNMYKCSGFCQIFNVKNFFSFSSDVMTLWDYILKNGVHEIRRQNLIYIFTTTSHNII